MYTKYLICLIETNYQIKMTNEHSLSNNKPFKSHLNAKSLNMFNKSCSNCVKRGDAIPVFVVT